MAKVFTFDQLCVMLMNIGELELVDKIKLIDKLKGYEHLEIYSDGHMESVNYPYYSDNVSVSDGDDVLLELNVCDENVTILECIEGLLD